MSILGKKVIVTGASGFIGSHLCKKLLEYDCEIYGISRSEQSEENIHWITGNLSELEFVEDTLNTIKPDTIFHLASFVLGSRDIKVVIPTFESNLVSTLNILRTATEMHCRRIVLSGSLEESINNSKKIIPQAPYAAAKIAASAYARMFHALYETPIVIAKLFMVYGPNQQDLKKLIPYTILSLLEGKQPKFSSGVRLVDWIYVKDVVDGLIAVAREDGVVGKTIDIGSGALVPIRDVITKIYKLMEIDLSPEFGAMEDRPMEKEIIADVKKTFDYLKWKPKVNLEDGLKETIEWYTQYFINQNVINS